MSVQKTRAADADDELEITESEIVENLEETFPARDAPSWPLGCTRVQERDIRKPGER